MGSVSDPEEPAMAIGICATVAGRGPPPPLRKRRSALSLRQADDRKSWVVAAGGKAFLTGTMIAALWQGKQSTTGVSPQGSTRN